MNLEVGNSVIVQIRESSVVPLLNTLYKLPLCQIKTGQPAVVLLAASSGLQVQTVLNEL